MRCFKLSKNFFYGFSFVAHRHICCVNFNSSRICTTNVYQVFFSYLSIVVVFFIISICANESVYHFALMYWLQSDSVPNHTTRKTSCQKKVQTHTQSASVSILSPMQKCNAILMIWMVMCLRRMYGYVQWNAWHRK